MKKTISVLLALVLLLGAFPFALPAAAADDPQTYSGTYGDDITWTLENGVLTVSGSGVIGELFMNQHASLVKKVIINEGITELGKQAFCYMSNIESIVLPDSLETIGQVAFWDCWALKNITFGANLKYISSGAFPECRRLETVILPDSLTYLGAQAFYGCNRLKKILIPAGVTSIGVNTFYECSRLEQLIILNGNAEMDDDCLAELHGATPTIYSYAGGSVEAFATEKGFNFVELSNNDTVIETVDGKPRAFGTCGNNIEWTLEDGVLTVSGHGAIEPQKRPSTVDNVTWNEATQKIEYTTSPFVSEGSFPWDDVLVRIYTEHFGVDPFSGLLMRYYTDDLTANDIMEFMQEQLDSVRSIVIEEGITSICPAAFSQFLPERIVLPSTLTSLGSNAFHAAITTDLIVKNPALDFSQGGISLVGCYNGENAVPSWFASSQAYTHENLRELSTSAMIEMLSDEGLKTFAQAAALIDGYGDAAYENYVLQPWREYGIETPEDLAAKMIDIFNTALGTNYTAVNEILFPVPTCACEFCTHGTCLDCKRAGCSCCACKDFNSHPVELGSIKTLYAYNDAFYETFYGIYDEIYDDDFIEDRTPHYALGNAPIGEYYGENGAYNVDLTPASWLTVYGYAGSTAEAAAQTSGVNFQPLCPTDYTHSVVETAAVEADYSTFGRTTGWYCEDCGTYLAGHELIMPTNFNGTEDDFEAITLDEPFEITLEETTQSEFDYLKIYTFTPSETKPYTILGENAYANYLDIYDSDLNLVAQAPSNVADLYYYIYSFTTELTADQTYYFLIRYMNFGPAETPVVRTYTLTAKPPHGTFGEGFSWIFENNTLTISGEGPMPDFSDNSPPVPWRDYFVKGNVKNDVVLKEGVTRIGKNTIPSYSLFSGVGLKELTVLNPACDLSELRSSEPAVLRGYPGSTAESFVPSYEEVFRFIPLCPTDYTHSVTEKAETAPTCTETGVSAGWYCEDCGRYLSGGETINATGHRHTRELGEIEPTRREHGFTAGVYCDDCKHYVSGGDIIHNKLGAYEIIKEPTETEEGEAEIYCTVCGGKGLYAIEKLEPQPEQPEQPGDNGGKGKNDDNFFRRLANGIMNFFLRLIKWLGGGKK